MLQNGKNLSMHSDAIWKGDYSHNGTLLKIHENAYTIGYSALLAPDGKTSGTVKFGDGVFYDAKEKNNKVYAGAPTENTPSPVFAGIVVREPAIASGYPATNDEVAPFQKGLLVKEGYVIYKNAPKDDPDTDASSIASTEGLGVGSCLCIAKSNGKAYFTATKPADTTTGYFVGKVVAINPDDLSVTVYISPAFYM